MNVLALTFLGSGAARKIGLGFQPDFVTVRNIGQADIPHIIWNKHLENAAAACDGILFREDTNMARTVLTVGTGVSRYAGGDIIAASSAANLVPADMVPDYAGDMRRHSSGVIDTWNLDTAGNRTGHVNAALNTSYVGVGSKIRVETDRDTVVERTIVAITNAGSAADELTLDRALPSGRVIHIGYKHGLVAAPVGFVMPAGIALAETTHVNASGEICYVEAGRYTND